QEWAACFDISDKSGNPKIIVVNLDNTKYYETFENFDTWLKEAENDGW
ncbi:TPA: SMI1/KNR4 family protein, partial [Neisseria meningitidis]